MITPIDIEAPGNSIIYKAFETQERIDAFRSQAEAAKADGSVIVMQINHCGRQSPSYLCPNPISASDVKLLDTMGMKFGQPRAMTLEDIEILW